VQPPACWSERGAAPRADVAVQAAEVSFPPCFQQGRARAAARVLSRAGAAPRADVAVEAAEVEAGVRADAQVGVRGQQGGARGRVRAAAARHDLQR